MGKPLSQLNLILFLLLAHQWTLLRHRARPRRYLFTMETIITARAIVAIARRAFLTRYAHAGATWSCRRLSSHSIGIERWCP